MHCLFKHVHIEYCKISIILLDSPIVFDPHHSLVSSKLFLPLSGGIILLISTLVNESATDMQESCNNNDAPLSHAEVTFAYVHNSCMLVY